MYRFAKQSVFTVILIPLPAGMILSLHILMLLKRKFQPIRTSSRIQDKDGIFWRGTPSYVGAHNIYEIVSLLKQKFDMDGCFELTIEANPGTLDEEKLLVYRDAE